jgi:hypothetical protein
MNRILLITTATVGLVVGGVYAAVTKMIMRAARALIESNQRAVAATQTAAAGPSDGDDPYVEKAKLPARIR